MSLKDRLILLETIENLRKLNPWRVNIKKELEKVYNILKEYFNLVIAGIAADNAAYIYNMKINEIDKITRRRDISRRDGEPLLYDAVIPPVEIQYTPHKYLIDISELIEQLNELLERELSKKMERSVIEVRVEDLRRYLEQKLKETRSFIMEILEKENMPILFSDLAKLASKHGIDPLYLLYAVLFLTQEGLIGIELVENDEYVEEIIIRKED